MKSTHLPGMIWLPRSVSILYVLFLMLFSFDVFTGAAVTMNEILGFFVHNIPSIAVLIALILTWKHPFFGGIVFIALSAAFTVFAATYRQLDSFMLISLPPFIIGILFFAAAKKRHAAEQKEETEKEKSEE